MKATAAWLLALSLVLTIWQVSMGTGLISPAVMASPIETAEALPRLFSRHGELDDLGSTLAASILAFVASVPLGVIGGVIVVSAGAMGRPWEFLLDFARSIPATALVPVFLIVFGLEPTTKIVIGAFSSGLVIAMATIAGLTTRNKTRSGIAVLYELTLVQRAVLVSVPEVLPQLFVGLRAGVSLALILVVVAEMLVGGDKGLGRIIADMRYTDDKPLLYAALILTGVIGYVYNVALRFTENLVIHWKGY